jgi:hypothetical protein
MAVPTGTGGNTNPSVNNPLVSSELEVNSNSTTRLSSVLPATSGTLAAHQGSDKPVPIRLWCGQPECRNQFHDGHIQLDTARAYGAIISNYKSNY